MPPHKQIAFKEWNKLSLPITEKVHGEVFKPSNGGSFKRKRNRNHH